MVMYNNDMLNTLGSKHDTYKYQTVGVLGGMGAPEATIEFEYTFHKYSRQFIPQKYSTGYPPLITAYFREVPLRVKSDGAIEYPIKPNRNLLLLVQKIGSLSDFLVITSNTPHFFKREIEQASGKNILSIVDETVKEIKKRKLKKVGIIAIGITLKNKLYQTALIENRIQFEDIPEDLSTSIDAAIFHVMEGSSNLNDISLAESALNYLKDKKVEAIILGCTELPILFTNYLNENYILNPISLVALAAVKKSVGIVT